MGSVPRHPQIQAERDINYSSEGKGDRVSRTETFQACMYISLVKEDLHGYANLKQGQRNITLSYAPKDKTRTSGNHPNDSHKYSEEE